MLSIDNLWLHHGFFESKCILNLLQRTHLELTQALCALMKVCLMSLCAFQRNVKMVIEDCNEALRLNPKYQKALMRRATACEQKGELTQALEGRKSWAERLLQILRSDIVLLESTALSTARDISISQVGRDKISSIGQWLG